MNETESYDGILTIGDPHLESRVPGFRKDDYPRVAIKKLEWCLNYAHDNRLLPIVLGDIFHLPRDNANWLVGELMILFRHTVLGIYGNHDVRQNELTEDDTLDILVKAGKYLLLDENNLWQGVINGCPTVVGGTSWGKRLPTEFISNRNQGAPPVVIWVTHHDARLPGYEDEGRFDPKEIPGIHVIVNGHIHRKLEDYRTGNTLWITPGSIVRRTRTDASRQHVPAVLQLNVTTSGISYQSITVPHMPFDEVFHEAILPDSNLFEDARTESAFVARLGLDEMLRRKTESSAGLISFLELNISQFEKAVADEILLLARKVTGYVE